MSQISHLINITHTQHAWKHMIGQSDSILVCDWLVFGLCMAKGHVSMLTHLGSKRTTIMKVNKIVGYNDINVFEKVHILNI